MKFYRVDDDGVPHEFKEAFKREEPFERRLVRSRFEGGAWISTVWMPLSMGRDGDEEPTLWETMAFYDEDSGKDMLCRRYKSQKAAIEDHRDATFEALGELFVEADESEELYDPPPLHLRLASDGLVHLMVAVTTAEKNKEPYVWHLALCGLHSDRDLPQCDGPATCLACVAQETK